MILYAPTMTRAMPALESVGTLQENNAAHSVQAYVRHGSEDRDVGM